MKKSMARMKTSKKNGGEATLPYSKNGGASMKVIYKPAGKAGEYANWACNLYLGCRHSCKYCYVPLFTHQTKEGFHSTINERKNILRLLEKDAKEAKITGIIDDNVLFCFLTDPYQPTVNLTTRKALEIMRAYDIPFTILTKGGTRAIRDFDLYSVQDCFATTLTFVDETKTKEWEPWAESFEGRFTAIKEAKKRGIKTWVSIEPVIEPSEALKVIWATHEYVDLYKVGKLNHYKIEVDWKKFANDVVELLEKLGKPYYIKKELAKYL